MAVPKRRLSKTKKNIRRSHDFLEKPATGVCPNCGEMKRTHYICKHCGYYNGVQYKAGVEE